MNEDGKLSDGFHLEFGDGINVIIGEMVLEKQAC